MELIAIFMIVLGSLFILGPFLTYTLVGWGSQAYFDEKLKYHAKLLRSINKGEGDGA